MVMFSRQAVNNSTFEDDSEIGNVVFLTGHAFIPKHRFKATIIGLQVESINLFT